ncbi:hypothetical protein ACHAW5_007711 [Stephanodiscus triporus]|uniref:Uncharacterized protein n=1 Tax=Stephanodiscus triporus TaxID=2934178 RepID=A0ABD3MKH4_9STRA
MHPGLRAAYAMIAFLALISDMRTVSPNGEFAASRHFRFSASGTHHVFDAKSGLNQTHSEVDARAIHSATTTTLQKRVKTTKTNTMSLRHFGTSNETISPSSPLFPRSAWCIVFIVVVSFRCHRRYLDKRRPRSEDLIGKVIHVRLEYYGAIPLSEWNGDELEKYDV